MISEPRRSDVSAQGLGCMGMSECYGPADWDESIATIHRALDLGVTFLDTADVYGAGHNEVLVGRAIARPPRRGAARDQVRHRPRRRRATQRRSTASAAYVKRSLRGVAAAPRRRRHRPVLPAPAAAGRRDRGDRRRDGRAGRRRARSATSGCPRSTTSCCAARTPCTRSPRCRASTRCGRAIPRRPCSPRCASSASAWCRSRRSAAASSPAPSTRPRSTTRTSAASNPRFAGRGRRRPTRRSPTPCARWPQRHGVAPAQVALAWVHGQAARLGVPVVPIPGTKRVKWLEQNVAALDVDLADDDLADSTRSATRSSAPATDRRCAADQHGRHPRVATGSIATR